MRSQINYRRNVKARAMSKSPCQAGMELEDESYYSDGGKNVVLHSINAKDGKVTSHLHLQIPKEDINRVIEALKHYL